LASRQKLRESLSKNNLRKYIFIKSAPIVEYKALYIIPTYSKEIELLILIVTEDKTKKGIRLLVLIVKEKQSRKEIELLVLID
jgi:hypothetical protein